MGLSTQSQTLRHTETGTGARAGRPVAASAITSVDSARRRLLPEQAVADAPRLMNEKAWRH